MSQKKTTEMTWSHWHDRLHKKLTESKNLIPQGSYLLLAVSGGQDSMVLVKLLVDLQRLHQWKLHIWHGNHNWHDKSKQTAEELQIWCEKQNLEFHCDHAIRKETNTENNSRDWRYAHLEKLAKSISSTNQDTPCQHVLTGHTSSDRAETLIMNLARGTDLTGLTSLRETRLLQGNIQLVRPLLCFSRNETYQICKDFKLPIWVDPSNQNLEFNRNKIRQIVLPILEELHQGCSLRIASLAERLTYYQQDQKALALLAIEAISSDKGLSRIKLMHLPLTARSTVLAKWLEKMKGPILSATQLEILSKKIAERNPPGKMQIAKKCEVIWTKKLVQLTHPLHSTN